MQSANAFPETETQILGIVLLAVAAILLISVVWTTSRDLHDVRTNATVADYRSAAKRFYALMSTLVATDAALIEGHARHRQWLAGNPVRIPIRLQTALRWINMPLSDFAVIMEEVEQQFNGRRAEVIAGMLFAAKSASSPASDDGVTMERIASDAVAGPYLPSPSAWNALVSKRVGQAARGRAQKDVAACGRTCLSRPSKPTRL